MNVLLQPISRFFLSVLCIFFSSGQLSAASLNGTVSFVYKNDHHVFSDGDIAQGFVRMGGGFTIKPGAKATLDTVISVSGAIDLRETGIMQLVKGLQLDSGVTWSSGGYINGRGNSIMLNGPLSIPASKVIRIIDDTVINGNGNILKLDDYARFIIENNATLTLKNIIIKNTKNSVTNPCLKVAGARGKLAFDNVCLAMSNDFLFEQGTLFFHHDVIFRGTSAFIYTAAGPSFVAPKSSLCFDIGTTFSFAPATTLQDLFVLQDENSELFLNGCTLKTTSSGMRLTKGRLTLNNKVFLESSSASFAQLSALNPLTSVNYGTAIYAIDWNKEGTVLAIGGDGPISGNELELYSFNGSVLSLITSQDYGSTIRTVAWHPGGDFLALGGDGPGNVGGFTSSDQVRLYSLDGSTLTARASIAYGAASTIYSIAWHPSGSFLAIGGEDSSSGNEIQIYRFNGSTLVFLTSVDYGTVGSAAIRSLAWNPAGTVLAVGGAEPDAVGGFGNTHELRLYSFNGTSLTALTSVDYGPGGSAVYSLAWSHDGTLIAVGGLNPTSGNELDVYTFNGSSLSALTSKDYGGRIQAITWNPSGAVLSVGGLNPSNSGGFTLNDDLRVYTYDGSASLLPLTGKEYGTQIYSLKWNPFGTILAIGGNGPQSVGGFSNQNELRLYTAGFSSVTYPQAASRSIVFGNSSLGSGYNLNVEVLGGAYVIVDGKIVDDSA